MSGNLLAAIRSAVGGWTADDESSAGAAAPTTEETVDMSTAQKPAGGTETGISQADHDAAVAAARNEGRAAGAAEATERLSSALGAEGVKGDGGRMAAALDLAVKSPGMSGADVAAFVRDNVAAARGDKPKTDAASYEQQRIAAAGVAQPGVRATGTAERSNWTKAVGMANRGVN